MDKSNGDGYGKGSESVRILVADSLGLFREAVRTVLEEEADLRVVGVAADGMQAVAEAERMRPDLAFVEAGLPNCDGIRATRLITERVPECRVLVLTEAEDDTILIKSVQAGARGYLTKESPLSELIEAARAMHRGETRIPRRMLGSLLDRLVTRLDEKDVALQMTARLTSRERQVLALVARGADNEAIAQALVISPQTARTHVGNIMGKLGVHTRLEAAAFVTQNGLLGELTDARR